MLRFDMACEEDAPQLQQVQFRAFHGLNPPDRPELNGPPGYDSVEWQLAMLREVPYVKMLEGETIIGGVVLLPKAADHCHIDRIFIEPGAQGRGVGSAAFAWLEKQFPQFTRWTLRTPAFLPRNQIFYERLGYSKTGELEFLPGFILLEYEKRIGAKASGAT